MYDEEDDAENYWEEEGYCYWTDPTDGTTYYMEEDDEEDDDDDTGI